MAITGIHGQRLEVTVVGCNNLKDTEWFSRQDPYVCLEYGERSLRTKTCTDGSKNPTFRDKFIITLIEDVQEIHVMVWNSNTLTPDYFIGSVKVHLNKVLSQGYDDSSWTLRSKQGRSCGELKLIMYYQNGNKSVQNAGPSAPSSSYPQPPPHHYPPLLNQPPPAYPSATYLPPPPPVYPPPPHPYYHPAPPPPYPGYYPGFYPPNQ